MATTAHLGITLVEQAQAQKEVTVNEALIRLDALLNNGAITADATTPPVSPASGDVYLVGTGATGAWAGHATHITYFDQIWRFITPKAGSTLWIQDAAQFLVFDGSIWNAATPSLDGEYQRMRDIPASQLLPALSAGCAPLALTALGAGKPDIATLDFDASTVESATFSLSMPPVWNAGTLTAQLLWSHGTAAGSYGVVWSLSALACGDTGALATSYGTAVTQADTGGTADTLYITPITAAITPSGTAAAGGTVWFRLSRLTTDSADTLGVDARLHGVRVFYTVNGLENA
jgi:Protein of unknown function (DUF2793)